ncbi:MAG: hypothetical protein OEM94_01255 [Acidimicrobiia bacterium]|nr:hypothetical protein [Acidimicrobiia bacterium]
MSTTQDSVMLIIFSAAIVLLLATAWVAGRLAYTMYPAEIAQKHIDAEFARIVSRLGDI